jgi:uncharacterized iron-regulated membrane protein
MEISLLKGHAMRAAATILHRWAGLITAVFLIFSGLTGAVISWDHELDELLNPHLNEVRSSGPPRDALALAREIEARHPHAQVTYIPLAPEAGHSYGFGVEPRVNPATQRLYELGFNQVFIDPASGEELGKREWGAVWPITRETFVSFLYKLHYSLHLPEVFGTDQWGIWLLGIIAMVWTIDCFVGLVLTLPARRRARLQSIQADDALAADEVPAGRSFWQRWKPSWKVRTKSGAYKLNFDLHRAFSLWTWLLLFIIAFTAFSLNLYREVFFPAMSLVSNVTPSPFDLRTPRDRHEPIMPAIDFVQTLERANAKARERGWDKPAGSMFYSREYGIYGVAFYRPEESHGAGGVGHQELYLDGMDGRVLGDREPWRGTAADIFVQAQFPLHSGRILGLPGRILISIMGVVVAMLAITGVVIWWRKRRAHVLKVAAGYEGRGARVAADFSSSS